MTTMLLKDQVLGAWNLVSFERKETDGQITYPLGRQAGGLILYTPDGHMSVQIMRSDREESFETASKSMLYRDLDYLAYTGSFHIDETNHIMTHDAEISLYPEWVGTPVIRKMELDGNHLRLSSNGPADRQAVTFTLLWERIKTGQ